MVCVVPVIVVCTTLPGRRLWYVWYMGKRTSVYLGDGLAAAVAACGVPLAELIRRGLLADVVPGGVPPVPPPPEVVTEAVVGIERPAPRKARAAGSGPGGGCRHPHVVKGWCRECGTGGHFQP